MNMKRVSPLPTLLTLANFSCGFIATVLCVHSMRWSAIAKHATDAMVSCDEAMSRSSEMLQYACIAIFLGMVFDLLDGRVARMTGSASRFGGELDSLADDCTFGVAPALIVATLWIQLQPETDVRWFGQVMVCGVVYAACAVLRLARYNVEMDTSGKNYFHGLPSPGAAGSVVTTVLFCMEGYLDVVWEWLSGSLNSLQSADAIQMRFLGLILLLNGVMMVTRIRFVHVANRFLGGRKRFTYLVATIFLFGLLVIKPVEVLFTAFNGYIIVCVILEIKRQLTRKPTPENAVTAPASTEEPIKQENTEEE